MCVGEFERKLFSSSPRVKVFVMNYSHLVTVTVLSAGTSIVLALYDMERERK